MALTPNDLAESEKIFRMDGDWKDNFLYENVQTINAGVFRARFKNILLPIDTPTANPTGVTGDSYLTDT